MSRLEGFVQAAEQVNERLDRWAAVEARLARQEAARAKRGAAQGDGEADDGDDPRSLRFE